jgi:hypothetical protein
MSVIPLFTYPNLSLYSHGVITVLLDLQIFPCPTIEDATCVHLATSSPGMTFGALMTSESAPITA